MNYAFYITNHGFGHASRNVPIIKELLLRKPDSTIFIKSDGPRRDFLKRNLGDQEKRIKYYDDCTENGLVLKSGAVEPDVDEMKRVIQKDLLRWDGYIQRECDFLRDNLVEMVISDVVCWAIKAAHKCDIPTLLIGNFSWAQMYKYFYTKEIWEPYLRCYQLADKAMWYEIHDKELENYCENTECISMVSRPVDFAKVDEIQKRYSRPIIFVSLGASIEVKELIDVSSLPYDFLVTRGIKLCGENVHELPLDMINTPDYIAAADYVIAKGGWSTVAEILLQKKRCALLLRGDNSEDNITKETLEKREHCVCIYENDLKSIETIISKIDALCPHSYDIYHDDTKKICDTIQQIYLLKRGK